MDLQIISRDGEPEYAVLPWAQYQALLNAAGLPSKPTAASVAPEPVSAQTPDELPTFDQLCSLREAKGLAIEVLARTVGISPAYLGMIERGEREPDAAIRRSLAWELGVKGWREAV